MAEHERISRRVSLLRLGGIAAALAGRRATSGSASTVRVSASGAVDCVLTPELTEGPYYVAGERIRHDVAAAKPRGAAPPGTNFLRGVQRTNANGVATYRTQPYRSHGTRPDTTNAADAI